MSVKLVNFLRKMKAISISSEYGVGIEGSDVAHMLKLAEELYVSTGGILDELDTLGDFQTVWPRCRVWFPLQFRLCAEQVMWDRGGQWRRYVTGFNPVKVLGSATAGRISAEAFAEHSRMVEAGLIRPDAPVDVEAMRKRIAFWNKLRNR